MGGSDAPDVPELSAQELGLINSQVELLNELTEIVRGDEALSQTLLGPQLEAQGFVPTITETETGAPVVTDVTPGAELQAREDLLEPLIFDLLGLETETFGPETFRGEVIRDPETGERFDTEGPTFTTIAGREVVLGDQGGLRDVETDERVGQGVVDKFGVHRGPTGEIIQVFDPISKTGLEPTEENIATAQALEFGDILSFEFAEQAGFDEATAISGGADIEPTTEEGRQAAIQRGFEERTLNALEGGEAVSPALTRDLEQRREQLEEELIRDFGSLSDARLSSAGQERLERFDLFEADILEEARRGDLTTFEELGLTRQATESAQETSELGSLLAFLEGGSGSLFKFPGPVDTSTDTTSDFTSIISGFSDPLSTLAGQRELETQVSIAGAEQPSTFGTLAGTAAGSFFGPVGSAAGGALGTALFG